jgi:pilus assembly protein CpaF
VPARFISADSLMRVIERIVAPIGRRIDEGVPMVDARLPDGSRVNAIIPPLSLIGPILTIRRFAGQRYSMAKLVEIGALTPAMAEFLKVCVRYRKNIVVSGGTGSGKTTFLNALSEFIAPNERIVTIEDAAELRLEQPHVLSLEARPANVEGRGEITIRDLVRNALRMRPDRIIVGECRGGEALDMLQAMNTGHDGSLTTGHANSPRDLLSRLEVMVLMAGMDLPVRAIREQISAAVDVIVQLSRFSDGRRRVTGIVTVEGLEGEVILTQPLFNFRQKGVGASGEIIGEYRGLGQPPAFYETLDEAGIHLDRSIFDERTG